MKLKAIILSVCLIVLFCQADALSHGCSGGQCWVECHGGGQWCYATRGEHGNNRQVSCSSDDDCSASHACAFTDSDGNSVCYACKGWNGCGDK